MSSYTLVTLPNDAVVDAHRGDSEFVEIHLDKQYYVGDNLTLHQVISKDDKITCIKGNYKLFWNPDQCIDFVTSIERRKIFISLTDDFSYLLPLIHDIPQIVYIYIYSESPEQITYSNTNCPKLRAIVNSNLAEADKQLLNDIDIFQRDLLSVSVNNLTQRKHKLLIQEPLILEEAFIIWIDNNNDADNADKSLITNVIQHIDVCFDIQHCVDIIKSFSLKNKQIFLISSHPDIETLLKEVADLLNVISVYIFDREERIPLIINNSMTKLRGKYSDLKSLSIQLSHDYKSLLNTSPLPISIFHRESNQKTIRDLSKESARFLWLQLLIDILLRTPCNDQAKEEMLDECRTFYQDDNTELRKIEEFAKTYKSTEAIKYYTGDSFLYRLFNQAFRTENIDFIFLFRFFLIDIYNHLQGLYSEQFLTSANYANNTIVVYRGQSMKLTEFDQIKNSIGRLISIGTFFSTTKNHQLAVIYSESQGQNGNLELLSVVFEIEVNLTYKITKRPFASVEHISKFPDEEEILFSVGSTFRILDVRDRRADDGYWLVQMIMVQDDDDKDLNELRSQLDKQYSQYGNLCDLGCALIGMCDYDRAERYFQMLLEYTSESNPSFGIIHNSLGIISVNRGDYQKALEYQELALDFFTKRNSMNNNRHHIANTNVHIGAAYRSLGQLDLALEYFFKAANMQSPEESLAFTYNEIALTYRDKAENHLALEYFLKALDIEKNVLKLPKYHPKLATAYNNIGEIYTHLGDGNNASNYLQQALEIRLKGSVSTHNDLAATYNNLGSAYLKEKEFQKALEMFNKALDIDTSTFHADHVSLAGLHSEIADVHLNLNDLTQALYHGEKALRIILGSQSKDNQLLLTKFQYNLGIIQYKLGNSQKALKMAEKAFSSISTCSTEDQRTAAYIDDLFSKIYEKDGDMTKALEYSEKAIKNAKIWAMRNRTFEIEYFLYQLDSLKNKVSAKDNQNVMSVTATKAWLDRANIQHDIIPELEDELRQTLENNIKQRLEVLGTLISMYSRQKNDSMAMKYFDQAQTIYTKHQMSDLITKAELEYAMAVVYYNAALHYHRQQDWNMCLNMLTKSLDLALRQNEEHTILPEIYYSMASTYAHRRELDKAMHYYELTISTGRKRYPDDHPDMQRYCFQFESFKNAVSKAYSKGYLKQ
ncbi:unnamed protein product [Adineta steineri]|uniref:NAD(P)(+)--arginine ADP-ribosyltransferase n=1 Tax=Adineta steineri TaxID=433720 RepID=A0A814PK62_9BILA|nr:unnamed protein product [Adineta steineri]CAF3738302.1 unnamed protein product [Adineta steineri]